MTAEELANRLNAALDKRRNTYLHAGVIQQCITEALHPVGISTQYPMMMYRDGQQLVVNSAEHQADAEREGWGHVPPPQFAPGFPQHLRERLTTEGGSKWPSGDVRKIMLRNEEELRLFRSVTDEAEWVSDAGDRGGRGVGVADLKQERRELLASLVFAENFSTAASEAADVPGLPSDVTTELTTTTGANPDEAASREE